MRTRYLWWVVLSLFALSGGAWWYIDFANSTHPAAWPMVGGDAGRRNAVSTRFPRAPQVLWTLQLSGRTLYDPVIAEDGTIFLTTSDSLIAVGADGKRQWTWRSRREVFGGAVVGRQGQVYVRDVDTLYAFNPAGQQLWQTPLPRTGADAPLLLGQGGTIYAFSSLDLYAISDDGTVKWHIPSERFVYGPVESKEGLVLILTSADLIAYTRTGDIAWRREIPGDRGRTVAVGFDGRIYVSGTATFTVLDHKGNVVSQDQRDRGLSGALAVGKDFIQDGAVRRSATGQPQWVLDRGEYGYVNNAIVDQQGNMLVQIAFGVPGPDAQSPGQPGLVLVDGRGKRLWRFPKWLPTGRASMGQNGRICFVGYNMDVRSFPSLVCIGDR